MMFEYRVNIVRNIKENDAIDFVIPWVDGSDENWIAERNKYAIDHIDKNNVLYRDWDNLQYFFRAIEKYAPWVHKVYFITYGHTPEWLNTNNPKLVIVNHKDYIPEKYLPTFSSHVIELNLHRIKGLSSKFVYFNDDIFLNNYVKPEDFFINDLPCDTAMLNVHCPNKEEIIYDIQINNVRLINSHFDFKKILKEKHNEWFNFKYGLYCNMQNLIFSKCNRFPGFQPLHVCNSYLKSSFEDVWKAEEEELNRTCLNKFRTRNDVNQYLIKDWQIVNSKFTPSSKVKHSKVFYLDFNKNIEKIKKTLFSKKIKFICLNDGNIDGSFESIKDEINEILNKKFPQKSSFEL